MILLSELLGQDAISLNSAETEGVVKGVRIEGQHITDVGLSKRVIRAAAVRSFEGEALTFDDAPNPDTDEVKTLDPRGLLILDMEGNSLGNISDLRINADGMVQTILSEDDEIDGSRLVVIGSYAALCRAAVPLPA